MALISNPSVTQLTESNPPMTMTFHKQNTWKCLGDLKKVTNVVLPLEGSFKMFHAVTDSLLTA